MKIRHVFLLFLVIAAPLAAAETPVMRVQTGHSDSIYSLGLSGDGRYALTASEDNSMRLWDLWTAKEIRAWHVPMGNAYLKRYPRCVFLPGNRAVHLAWSKLRVHDCATGALLFARDFSPDESPDVSVSRDGSLLCVAAGRNFIVFETAGFTEAAVLSIPGSDWPHSSAFIPGGRLAAVYADKKVRLWDISQKKIVGSYERHRRSITDIAISPDGSLAATLDDIGIHLWRTSTGESIGVFPDDRPHEKIAFMPDGKSLVYTTWCKPLTVLSVPDMKIVKTMANERPLPALAVGPDGACIVAGTKSGGIIQWDAATGRIMRDIRRSAFAFETFGVRGKAVFGCTGSDRFMRWNALTGRPVIDRTVGVDVWFTAVSPDGSKLAIGRKGGGAIQVTDADSGVVLATIPTKKQFFEFFRFTPDGGSVVYPYTETEFRIFDLKTKSDRKAFAGSASTVRTVALSSDGSVLFSGGHDLMIRRWDGRTGKETAVIHYGTLMKAGVIRGLVFSPDNKLLAANVNNEFIKLFDSASTEMKWMIKKSPADFRSMAFSTDGSVLAVGCDDGAIRLLDAATGAERRMLTGHANSVRTLAYSDDGALLFSSARDGRLRIWRLSDGRWIDLIAGFDAAGPQWLSVTDDGYWDGSPGCGNLVAMVRGMDCWNIDQFASVTNRPDMVLERLGNGDTALLEHYRRHHAKRMLKSAAGRAVSVIPPGVKITASERVKESLKISFECVAGTAPPASYQIYAGGVPLYASPGMALPAGGRVRAEVPLSPDAALIEVSCADTSGVESFRAPLFAPWGTGRKGRLIFAGFGVSRYRDEGLNLRYAAKDAGDLGRALEAAKKGFLSVETFLYLDENCTRSAFESAAKAVAGARPEDTVVVFIAGHGVHDSDADATYYFLTHEADTARLAATAVPFGTVEGLCAGTAARRKLLLMDTCESGEIEDDTRAMEAPALKAGFSSRGIAVVKNKGAPGTAVRRRAYLNERDRFIYNDLTRRSGTIVFSSCRGGELSYERDEIRNGVFTRGILDALAGAADSDGDGVVSVAELRTFVSEEVPRRTSTSISPDGLQHPTVDRDNIHSRFGFPATPRR